MSPLLVEHPPLGPPLHHSDSIVAQCEVMLALDRADEAAILLSRASCRYPTDSRILALNGQALLALGEVQAALGALMLALRLQPGSAVAHARLVAPLAGSGDLAGALAHGAEAFRLSPNAVNAGALSGVLCQLCRYADALTLADTALGLRADDPAAWINRALALDGLRRTQEALAAGRRAIALAPNNATGRYHQGERLLRQGQLTAEAWRLYESRLVLNGHQDNSPLRVWRGEEIGGQTLLLHAEQGLGDTLQFVRYAPLAAQRAGRVILAVPPPLLRLLLNVPGVDHVVALGGQLPAFDAVCPLLSLPGIMGTTLDTIPPALPYADRFPPWTDDAPGLRVGLVWEGRPAFVHDRHRSLPRAALDLLSGTAEVQFYSLQQHSGLPPALPEGLGAIDLMLGIEDLRDTAAMIAGLDLVISVDTAVAHLAATMGTPVWLLSRFHGCWRWMEDREDSPWYPSLRIIRQMSPNDWGSVMLRVRRELAELAAQPVARMRCDRRRPAAAALRTCKLCATPSPAIGQVDFNRSCEDVRQAPLTPAGWRVTYHRCPQCALVFACDFDGWDFDTFRRHIYNADYARVDPDYAHIRPACSAALIASLFGEACRGMDVLDYGGGDGTLAALLSRDHAMCAVSYDPFDPATNVVPTRRFPLVTCFEVLEHTPDPRAAIRAIAALVQDDGLVLFSTLLQPADFDDQGMKWWYVAPRNGHVTLFSAQALKAAWAEVGFQMVSRTENLHMASRVLPDMAGQFVREPAGGE